MMRRRTTSVPSGSYLTNERSSCIMPPINPPSWWTKWHRPEGAPVTETYDRASILRRGAAAGISLAALGLAPQRAARRPQPRHDAQPRRLLDAEARDGEDHLRLPGDPAGPGRLVHPVLRRLDEPGEGRGRRPARRHRLPLDRRRREPPRRRGPRQPELGPAGLQRHRRRHRRRLRAPRRQPEEDQGLERPDQARRPGDHARTRSARARRSGTSSPPTARSGISARPTRRRSPTSSSSSRTSSRRTRRARTRRTRSSPARATS